MTDKLLAEWFWTDRWMGSSAFLLPIEPRGLYREMLTQAWRRGARLPNDHEAIRRAVGCTEKEWARCWPKIARYWRVDGEDLVNDTQLAVFLDARAVQERSSERGRRGAQARAQARAQASTQALPEQVLEDKPPSPSPSPRINGTPPTPRADAPGGAGRQLGEGSLKAAVARLAAYHRTKRGVVLDREARRALRTRLDGGENEAEIQARWDLDDAQRAVVTEAWPPERVAAEKARLLGARAAPVPPDDDSDDEAQALRLVGHSEAAIAAAGR